MLLKYFYDKALAHASYLVGCQKTGEALVVDPGRDIEPYLAAAKSEGLRIVAAAETHIHADFVSGSRELAERLGAKLYLSDEGPAEWKYQFADQYQAQLLHHGDQFRVGNVRFDVLHTPGHTPEHLAYLLTDEGGGASGPMGLFTGDFVFVGSIGRPDLLETAAGVVGSAELGARQLYHSMRQFHSLPDHLQVWPAHGAGSACGKGLGAVPSSTVGYEKRFNPALQFHDEQAFVDYILADQPETPFYFAVMKRVNKVGPVLLRELPPVEVLSPALAVELAAHEQVVDTREADDFAASHIPGTLNLPAESLVRWAGFLVEYDQPLYLVIAADALAERLRALRSIGIDNVVGYFDIEATRRAALHGQSYRVAGPEALHSQIASGEVTLVDVRSAAEYQAGHVPEAVHHFLGTLRRQLDKVDRSRPLVAQCGGGGRSAIAASILQRAGMDVTNMKGGYRAWRAAALPVNLA